MSWNYRIVKELPEPAPGRQPDPDPTYTVREVYYSGARDEQLSWTAGGVAPMGVTIAELRDDLTRMVGAWTRPVVIIRGGAVVAEVPIAEADRYRPGQRRTE